MNSASTPTQVDQDKLTDFVFGAVEEAGAALNCGQPQPDRARAYYGFSTLLCTPSSGAQPVGMALGTRRVRPASATS